MSEENTSAAPAEPAQPQAQATELPPEPNAQADGGAPQEGEPSTLPAESQPQEGQGETSDPKRDRFNRRFSDLSRQIREEREARIRAEARADALERYGLKPNRDEPQNAARPQGPPNPKDYPQGEFDPRYTADLAKHEIREEMRQERERQARDQRQAALDAELEQGAMRLETALQQAQNAAYESEHFENAPRILELGYVPVAQGGLPRYVVDSITESENAVYVAEVLGRDPEHVHSSLRPLVKSVRELAQMPPRQATAAIAKLDDRIGLILEQQRAAQQQPKPAPKPAPQPSPAPIPTVNGAGVASSKDPSKMSMKEYAEWRAAGGGTT